MYKILESAKKHGFTEKDILHAIKHALTEFEFEGKRKIIIAYIGPSENSNLVEIFSDTNEKNEQIIFHCNKLSNVVFEASPLSKLNG